MNNGFNKLSVSLIKEEFKDVRDIIHDSDILRFVDIPNVGRFYYGSSHDNKPSWLEDFFVDSLPLDIDLFNSSASGLLLTEIEYKSKRRIFAIPFGYGWKFLREGVREENFGLKTALSVIDPMKIKKMDRKNMSVSPKDTSEQLAKFGGVADFGLDIEQDLVRSVTGKSTNKGFGRTVDGKDALNLSVSVSIHSIQTFLATCMEKYESNDYKKNFAWIDYIGEIRSPGLKMKLDFDLIKGIRAGTIQNIWMAVPELINWENISEFRYSNTYRALSHDDISLQDFLGTLSREEIANLSIDILKNKLVFAIRADNDNFAYKWSVYSCLYAELVDPNNKNTYLLSNGKWYLISPDFTQSVNDDYFRFIKQTGSNSLPICRGEKEDEYNKRVAQELGFCLMDHKMIFHGGGSSQIEFCDLFTNDKKIYHIKRYSGSSVLSHLFSQGLVSGELFLRDNSFLRKVNDQLDPSYRLSDLSQKPTARDYEIVFGIISTSSKDLELPFFSKITLRNAINRLEAFGYKVSFVKILNQR